MRIVFIYTPAHNFSVICPLDSYQNFGDPGQKTCFMYTLDKGYDPMLPSTSYYAMGWVLLCFINVLLCLEFNL